MYHANIPARDLTGRRNCLARAPADCWGCQARRNGLCEGATPDELRAIEGCKWGDREIGAGGDLFGIGESCDSVYNLVEGWMFLYNILEDGRRQILHFALPGAVLGFHPGWGAMTTYGVQALTDSVVCVIPRKALEPLSKRYPGIGMRLAWLISRDNSLAFDHLTSIGRRSARERVAHLLLELYVRYYAQWPGGRIDEMQIPVTQEHIGDAIGLTLVHVNRVLRDLRQEGIVEFHYRRLRILDPDGLIDVAGLDPQLAMAWMSRRPIE
ncbi:MAG: helix-turn-helix domain-containing protein [Rhodobacteraceae bacterium]|nr:helix-turn-helix domain-containing protein [Paracoccaceae bacterium]